MPGKIKVKILAGRNLPVMDRSGDTTDAYVEIKFGTITYKTDVCRKSLNPQWNSEWYRFEVDDAELQDEPLQIRLMDHDTYSANDAIGKVYLNLNPLLLPGVPPPVKNIWTLEASMNSATNSQGGCVMTGWIPVYDTMHGIRGEVNIIVKVELFLDFNKFRQSSCGVQFFYSPNIPYGYRAQVIHGFVEELLVSDDPEYKWIDKIRTPRASNEARQTLFFKLSGEVQRKIGLKALDLGGNAVIGYMQTFDLEGESGIVARGIGTAVTLVKLHDFPLFMPEMAMTEDFALLGVKYKQQSDCSESDESIPILNSSLSHTPIPSTYNLQSTRISNTFPKSGVNVKKSAGTSIKVIDHKSTGKHLRRNLSTHSSTTSRLTSKRGLGSSLSLTDELSNENPLKLMLALEDMRGEPSSNRFSQGLRNLRYLPQSLLAKRSDSKLSDYLDEESDFESAYSSSWSISDSTRPAVLDYRHSMKKKKLTHKKNINDGVAATLIRSVHSGLPLDSVREDRETPTPSPVNFLSDSSATSEAKVTECESSEETTPDSDVQQENSADKNNVLKVIYSKLKISSEDNPIPMISSSETDTSSSEDDPSESSTNYNILDDTSSLIDPVSFDVEKRSSPKFTLSPSSSIRHEFNKDNISILDNEGPKIEEMSLLDDVEYKAEENSLFDNEGPKIEEISLFDDVEYKSEVSLSDNEGPKIEEISLLDDVEYKAEENSLFDNEGPNIEEISLLDDIESKTEEVLLLVDVESKTEEVSLLVDVESKTEEASLLNDVESKTAEVSLYDDVESKTEEVSLLDDTESKTEEVLLLVDVESKTEEVSLLVDVESKTKEASLLDDVESKTAEVSLLDDIESKTEEVSLLDDVESKREEVSLFVDVESKTKEASLNDEIQSKAEEFLLPYDVEPQIDKILLLECKESIDVKSIELASDVEFVFPVDKAIIVLPKIPDSEPEKIENLIDISDETFKTFDGGKYSTVPWTPDANQTTLIPSKSETSPKKPPIDEKKHRLHRQSSYEKDYLEYSPSSDDEYYLKQKIIRYPSLRKEQKDKRLKEKSLKQSKRIERSETVIYKGPPKENEPNAPVKVQNLVPVTTEPQHDTLHLMVPTVKSENVNVRSPYSQEELQVAKDFTSEELIIDMIRKHRQSSMFELIRLIDTKMLIRQCHHEKRDSIKRKRHDRTNKNQTPSPIVRHTRFHRRKSRSKSPDNSKIPGLNRSIHSSHSTLHSTNDHSKGNNRLHDFPETLNRSLSNDPNSHHDAPVSAVNEKSNNLEMHVMPKSEESTSPIHKTSAVSSSEHKSKSSKISHNSNTTDNLCVPSSLSVHRQQDDASLSPACPTTALVTSTVVKTSQSPVMKNSGTTLHRRSSDSDLSITPKGNSLTGSDRSMGGYMKPTTAIARPMNQEALEMLEYPFITMQLYPNGFIRHIGGFVSARSVKLLERITNQEEPEGRDSWWKEIRMEVRSHVRALACNAVLGYREETSICDDVCVLSASGTAAVINLHSTTQDLDSVQITRIPGAMATSVESDRDKQTAKGKSDKSDSDSAIPSQSGKVKRTSESNDHEVPYGSPLNFCSLCHLAYSEASVPFRVNVTKCTVCRRAKVPDVLFTTIELPENIPLTGNGCFIQATVCKSKKDLRGELNAKEISDCLPFLEYELHSLLLNKLRVRGMNGIFGLKIQVTVGEKLVVGMAVGTAVFLTALPPPTLPKIASGNSWHNEEQLVEIRKTLAETLKMNREYYRLKPVPEVENGKSNASDTDESDDDLLPELNLNLGTKDACVLEIDDLEDMDRISLLIDERPPDDFHVVNTQTIPGLEDLEIVRNLQMFTQVSRSKITASQTSMTPSEHFARLLQTVYFKLRRMVPCALCDMQFRVVLPEPDEIQLCVVGMALGLGEPTKISSKFRRKTVSHSSSRDQVRKFDDTDMIFRLDEDQTDSTSATAADSISNASSTVTSLTTSLSAQKPRPRSPLKIRPHMFRRHRHVPLKERYGVDITPLSYLPGGRIERYLGNLNFFFIRESNSIRENGGLSGFTHSFVTEILAIVRAHVTALGGNAMVAYFMTHCVLLHSPHKNQGQCLINVGGDVVSVSYFADDKQGASNTNC